MRGSVRLVNRESRASRIVQHKLIGSCFRDSIDCSRLGVLYLFAAPVAEGFEGLIVKGEGLVEQFVRCALLLNFQYSSSATEIANQETRPRRVVGVERAGPNELLVSYSTHPTFPSPSPGINPQTHRSRHSSF